MVGWLDNCKCKCKLHHTEHWMYFRLIGCRGGDLKQNKASFESEGEGWEPIWSGSNFSGRSRRSWCGAVSLMGMWYAYIIRVNSKICRMCVCFFLGSKLGLSVLRLWVTDRKVVGASRAKFPAVKRGHYPWLLQGHCIMADLVFGPQLFGNRLGSERQVSHYTVGFNCKEWRIFQRSNVY